MFFFQEQITYSEFIYYRQLKYYLIFIDEWLGTHDILQFLVRSRPRNVGGFIVFTPFLLVFRFQFHFVRYLTHTMFMVQRIDTKLGRMMAGVGAMGSCCIWFCICFQNYRRFQDGSQKINVHQIERKFISRVFWGCRTTCKHFRAR